MDLYGKLNNPIKVKEYIGANTTTAKTNVDANTNTISVDVKKVPQPLIINFEGTDKDTQYDGSKEVTINVTTTESIEEMKEAIDIAFENVNDKVDTLDVNINGRVDSNDRDIAQLQSDVSDEVTARRNADTNLQNQINTKQPLLRQGTNIEITSTNHINCTIPEETIYENKERLDDLTPRVEQLENDLPLLDSRVTDIEDLIPEGTDVENPLTNKEFVNSSIATNTANFKGTFESITALRNYQGEVTNNDYAFVKNNQESPLNFTGNNAYEDMQNYDKTLLTNWDYAWVADGNNFDLFRFDIIEQRWTEVASNISDKTSVTLNSAFNRYKAVVDGNSVTWIYEYTLNNSSFTAQQWAAINSGITSQTVSQISTNANNITNLQTDKQDKLTSANAGSNIQITTNNDVITISATDTTYSAATTSSAGLMPALESATVATQTQATKFLREDGTWQAPTYTVNTDTTYSAGTGLSLSGTEFNMTGNLPFLTTAPTANNTGGVKIVILDYEPATKYNGYIYFITEN